MSISSLLPQRWQGKPETGRHNAAIMDILDTAPILPKPDGLVLFSMIGAVTVLPFLVAVKSLWRHLGRGRIAILDDGTLAAHDRTILAQHCGDPQIIRLEDVPCGPFPKGEGWEKLLTILDHRAGEYWLQLDSNTVTLGPVYDVERAIASNRSFALLDSADAPDQPLELAEFTKACFPQGESGGHLQAQIESRLGQLAPQMKWKYLRGSAGFSGFAAGNAGRDLATAFLHKMQAMLGEDSFHSAGTEQIAANLVIANEGGAGCLPPSRYLNYRARTWDEDCAFVHFSAAHRYDNGSYLAASQSAITRLKCMAGPTS